MKRHRELWTPQDILALRRMKKRGEPTARIARTLRRSIASIYQKVWQIGVTRR